MVSIKSVEKQLKLISFNHHAWGRAEVEELPNILLPDEKIFECVNGIYEGGFALLVATNVRLLLIDKKPFKFLTVEDLRFDMITEIDYSHRMFGASITVSSGSSKNLRFRSYNQQRLRKLIGHVQHRMAEFKREQTQQASTQQQHLEQINQQLQAYLLAQYKQQEALRGQLQELQTSSGAELTAIEPVRPGPQLSDYLFAQNLLKQYDQQTEGQAGQLADYMPPLLAQAPSPVIKQEQPLLDDIYAEGQREIFGKRQQQQAQSTATLLLQTAPVIAVDLPVTNPLEINPLKIAYSKLPMVLRNRRFGRSPLRGSKPVLAKS